MPRYTRKRKKDNSKSGKLKEQNNRIKLFREVFDVFIAKSYPVLMRFSKLVQNGKKIGYIRYKALEMALNYKIEEAINVAKNNIQEKVSDSHIEEINSEESTVN